MLRRSVLVGLSMLLPSGSRAEAASFRQTSISLYSPTFVWERDGPPAAVIANYVSRLGEKAGAILRAGPPVNASGSIVVALKPPRRSRVWVVTGEQATTARLQAALAHPLESVAAPPVRDVLAFALDFHVGGGGRQPHRLEGVIAVPDQWAKALRANGGRIPDDALKVVWPD